MFVLPPRKGVFLVKLLFFVCLFFALGMQISNGWIRQHRNTEDRDVLVGGRFPCLCFLLLFRLNFRVLRIDHSTRIRIQIYYCCE